MDPITIALIGAQAISGMYGAKKTNQANQRIARETNELNRFLFYEQNRLNRENWNLANVYNTPAMQRARYEDAGINPALALGNITPGIAQSVSPASPNPAVSPPPMRDVMAPLSQGLGQMAEYKLRQEAQSSNINLQNSQATLNNVTATGKSIENEYTPDYMKRQLALMEAEQRKYDMEIEQGKFTIDNTRRMTDKQIEMIHAQISKIISEVDFQNVMKSVKLYELRNLMPAQRNLIVSQAQNLLASIKLMGSQADLNWAEVDKKFYDQLEVQARTANIQLSTHQMRIAFGDTLAHLRSQTNLNNANARYRNEQADNYTTEMWSNIINQSLNTIVNVGSAIATGGVSTGLINFGKGSGQSYGVSPNMNFSRPMSTR